MKVEPATWRRDPGKIGYGIRQQNSLAGEFVHGYAGHVSSVASAGARYRNEVHRTMAKSRNSSSLTPILHSIDSPADLKGRTPRELEQLASEIRSELISSVTSTGGHLGASLGTVELSIALHYVFNSPKDKLV